MKKAEIMLTFQELKEFQQTGVTSHKYGGITYDISANDEGWPVCVGARIASVDLPIINFPGAFDMFRNNKAPYNKGK